MVPAQRTGLIRDELRMRLGEDPKSVGLDFSRKDAASVDREFLDWLSSRRTTALLRLLELLRCARPDLTPEGGIRPFEDRSRSRADIGMLRDWQKLDKKTLSPSQIELARDAYDDCIASLDRELGG